MVIKVNGDGSGDSGLAAKANETREKAARGEIDETEFMESFKSAIKAFASGYQDAWQKIRSERIARNVHKESGISDRIYPVTRGYQRLKEVRFYVGMEEPNSDSEEEDVEHTQKGTSDSDNEMDEENDWDGEDEEISDEYESDNVDNMVTTSVKDA